jgi:tol-pal system protein YbgF
MIQKHLPFLVVPFFLLSACASKNDLVNVQGDVSQLKTQTAGSYSEVSQLRDELASLKGIVEELQHNNGRSLKRLDIEDSLLVRKADDIDGRLARVEQYLGLSKETAAPSSSAPLATGKDAPVKPDQKAAAASGQESLFGEGLQKMKKGDQAGGREKFTSFIAQNPKSDRIDEARFYIGESYFNEKNYEKAILEYQVIIAKYPKSKKRAAALYKQAVAFEKIGDSANAKTRYKDLINVYPNSPEAKIARTRVK